MHSAPVLASVTKLSMMPPQAQRKVMAGSPPSLGVWVKFQPGHQTPQFAPIVIATTTKLSTRLS
jgi:hypothetical protein